MMSNSGFPFAPDYLNTLRLGAPVEPEVPPKKKGQKARKREAALLGKDSKLLSPKVKIPKTSAAAAAAAPTLTAAVCSAPTRTNISTVISSEQSTRQKAVEIIDIRKLMYLYLSLFLVPSIPPLQSKFQRAAHSQAQF